ncbi:Ig-like domain-containing protein, partial [Pseudomonas sp. PDM18]|uniref:Ig-like domain-containing protein n=1 Tax=Pseudomonas sp. PDM18 TaxID=2769253 RepID=UPI00177DB944
WSVQVSGTDLAKGSSIDATLVAHDAAGNQSSVTANRPYTVDVAAPDAASTQLTIDTVAGDDIVNLAESQVQQTISGKAIGEFQVGDVVSFKLNGTTYSATVAADGKWSVQVSGADLAKATSIDATLVAHDAAGNTGLITANHGYTVDVTAPAKPTIDTIYDEESKQSVLPGSNSEDNTPVITGSAEAGSTVIIKNGGKVIGSTTADNNGKWEFTPQTPLDEGAHELTVEAVDKVGNTSLPSAPFNFGVVPGGDDQPAMLSGGSAVFNYTVVLDTSGSMNGTGIAAAKHALLSMMSTVLYYGGTATFDLITFATSTKSHGSFTFAKATDADYSRLVDVINSLVATGGTNYVEALSTASQRIDSEMSAGIVENKQVFFLSDGDSLPVPTASQYASWQSLMANPPGGNMPIPVTTIGLGSGIRDSELSKITTSQTIMSPSIDDLAGIMLNNLFVDSSSGNLLSNDAKIIKDGKEVIAQVEHDGAIYRITGGKLEVQNPSAKVTASYDDLTGRLVLDTEMGVLTLYTKANANYVAGDYLYQLRPSTELNANIGDIAHWDYRYTAMDSQGHSQSATLQVSAELGQTISEAIEILSVSGGDSEFGAAGGAGRYITGSVAQAIASGNFLEVSVDKGKTWSQVSATDGKSWAFVDKSSHTADWTIQARISDGKGNSAYLTEQEVTWAAPAKAPTILGIPKADDGLLSATEANTGVEMTVSLANTGAKAGDIVHVQWGIALFDQTLTALDIDSGQVVVNVPKAVTNSGTTSQGVLYDFDVAVSIVSNGVAGESSLAYHVIGGGFSTKAISDSLSSASSTVVDNTYNGEGFTVTTSGASLEKTAQITNQKYAGLTVSDAAMADMLFTLDKPATRIGFTLSGLESGAEIIVYGTNGNEIHRETVSGTSSGYQYKAFSYQAVAGIEVSSFKVISGSDSLTMSSYTETQALHVTDTRELKIDDLSDSYYGTSSYDVVSLKYSAAGFLASTSNKGFHGGDGVDILKLEGGSHVFNLNLATSAGKLTGFEVLDITGFLATGGTTSGANTLTLSVKDVLENGQVDLFQASGKHTVQMMVKGDANDTVNLDDLLGATGPDYGDWALTGQTSVDNQSYNTYHHSGLDAELLIQSAVKVNLI